jgi:hypothetical protein
VRTPLTAVIGDLLRSGMIATAAYLIFLQALGLVVLMGRTAASKDVELLVQRHEVGGEDEHRRVHDIVVGGA